jgi:creatinine amidohydrolase
MTAPGVGAAAERSDLVLLPIGAVEQHGAHLPVDTDIRLGVAVTRELARSRPWTIIAPPVWWGLSGHHRDFPGLLTLRTETFVGLLEDLCESVILQGFRKLALIVGHGSNKPAVGLVVAEMMRRHAVPILQVNYLNLGAAKFERLRRSEPGGEFHAGELETALMLHVRSDLVHMERAVDCHLDPKEHLGHSAATRDIFGDGDVAIGFDLRASFPDGVAGDPTLATPELGADVFEAIVGRAGELVDEYHRSPIPQTQ